MQSSPVYILGYESTKFGELWDRSLFDLVGEVISASISSGPIDREQIDAVFFGNMLAGRLENNLHSSSKISELLRTQVPVYRMENACASGGVAIQTAYRFLLSGSITSALVVGAEKMTDVPPEVAVSALSGAASGEEQEAGLTFAGLYGMMAHAYSQKFSISEEDLSLVAVKNHYHGSLNEKAHFRAKITTEQVMQSSYVADPLKVLDSSPISDGASALLLTTDKKLAAKASHTSRIVAIESASDTISLKNRDHLHHIKATKIAAGKAYKKAKLKPADVGVAELHDCFTIAEVMGMEDLGFCREGEAVSMLREQATTLGKGGSVVINTSGGLKASGHPVGATGVKQVGELHLQLTGQAGKRQVKGSLRSGLAHNVGGSGGTAVVTLLES